MKKFLSETRKKANEIIQNPVPVQNFSLLNETEQNIFIEALIGQDDILAKAVGEFKLKYPAWEANDMGIFSYVYTQFPDFVLASISGDPNVAIERKRVTDDRFLKRVHEDLLYREKLRNQSEPTERNDCDHVKNLSDIRRISDDDQRVQAMVKLLLPTFKGETKDNWIECVVCNRHLICEHEYLMILEKTHPLQKDTIHKKILLKFSDGEFNGKFICGTCGQTIQDLEFDQNPEFDDNGRIMMGNEPITKEMETSLTQEIDKLLELRSEPFVEKSKSAAAAEGGKSKDPEHQLRVQVLDEITSKFGIGLPLDSYQRMMRVLARIVSKFTEADPEKYAASVAQQQKENPKARFPTYTEYKNKDMIINY